MPDALCRLSPAARKMNAGIIWVDELGGTVISGKRSRLK